MERDSKRGIKPFLWFTLYRLLELGAGSRQVKISTTKLSRLIDSSQQSASRHLQELESRRMISRKFDTNGSFLQITDTGLSALQEVYRGLKWHIENLENETFVFEGKVFSGLFEGAYYIGKRCYREQIKEKLGFEPYPGTLNLRLNDVDLERRNLIEQLPAVILNGFKDQKRAFGSALCYPVIVNDEVEGALLVAERTTYDQSTMEIIAPVYLRKHFSLKDGDTVRVSFPNLRRSSP